MKYLKFLTVICFAVSMSFAMSSCNSGDKNAEENSVDSTATNNTEPMAAAEPGNIIVVTHKVANFDKWIIGYEAHDSMRVANGIHSALLARGTNDSNTIMVVMRMDDINKAKAFIALPELKDAMKKSGVIGDPTISLIDLQMLDTSVSGASRVLVTHKIKDWAAWKPVFDNNKPSREAAGLGDRALGYNIDDNKMVTIAFVISDMKKAVDFSNSPELKQKMEEAGVEGPPSFFYYTVVKTY